MFLDCQHFAGSWGRYFVGNWFDALQCQTSVLLVFLKSAATYETYVVILSIRVCYVIGAYRNLNVFLVPFFFVPLRIAKMIMCNFFLSNM